MILRRYQWGVQQSELDSYAKIIKDAGIKPE
jgi:hypothetical protein